MVRMKLACKSCMTEMVRTPVTRMVAYATTGKSRVGRKLNVAVQQRAPVLFF